jgi:hypothetical protein
VKFKKCLYNWNDGTVDLYVADGTKISLICSEIESKITGSMNAMGKLEALKVENPIEYAQMALDGSMQKYCDLTDGCNPEQASTLFALYKKRYTELFFNNLAFYFTRIVAFTILNSR